MKDIGTRVFLSVCAVAFFFIPFWIWLSAWWLMAPEGFWQKAFLVGIGAWLLGAFQIVAIFFLLMALVAIWDN